MSKWDDWVQPEEDSDMLIYEEYQRYVEQVHWELEAEWEEWVRCVRCTDQSGDVSPNDRRSTLQTQPATKALDRLKFE